MRPHLVSSWYWRKILLNIDWCRGRFILYIGDEIATSVWLDYYLLDGQWFYDLLPFKLISLIVLSWDAKVSDIIEEDTWCFSSSN